MDKKTLEKLINLRDDFVEDFSIAKIEQMQLDEYVIGKQNENTYCYRLEYQLKELGNNGGANASKYGVWYGQFGKNTTPKYRATKNFADGQVDNIDVAFANVKSELIKLISADPNTDEGKTIICKSRFAPLVLGKVLYLYHHKDFLPIFSLEDMKYFIYCLNGSKKTDNNFLALQEELKRIKQEQYAELDNIQFSKMLYKKFYSDIEDVEDYKLLKQINKNNNWLRTDGFNDYMPMPKTKIKRVNDVDVYPRNQKVSKNAIILAGCKCEFSEEHKSFMRKNADVIYTEAHHLIPLKYHADFDTSLDVEANVVSLCSECHNKLHYGRDIEGILKKLYDTHKEILIKSNIKITFEELLNYYGVKNK